MQPDQSLVSGIKAAVCLSIIIYVLVWCLQIGSFYLTLNTLRNLVLAMVVSTLFVDRLKIRVSMDLWVWMALFGIIAFLSTHASQNYLVSSIKLSLDLFILAFGIMLVVLFSNQLHRIAHPLLLLIVLVFVLLSGPATFTELISQIPKEDREVWSKGFNLTHSFELSHYEHLRMFSFHAFIASCSAYILLRRCNESMIVRGFYLLLFSVCFFGLLLAYGRGSLLAFFSFIAAEAFWSDGVKSAIKATGAVAASAFIVYLALYFSPLGVITEYLLGSFNRGGEAGEIVQVTDAVASGRLSMWSLGLEQAMTSPIFGHGASSAAWLFDGSPHSYASQPHNMIIQYCMDYGFIGAALFAIVAFRFLLPLLKRYDLSSSGERARRSLVAFVFGFFVYGLTDGIFYHPFPMAHFAVLMAVLVSLDRVQRQ